MAAARLATRRRRQPQIWALFGAVLGPAALGLLQLAPPGRCWTCAAPTQGWMTLCPWCGEDIRGPAAAPAAAREVATPEVAARVHGPLTVIDGTAPRATRASSPSEALSTARRGESPGRTERRIERQAHPAFEEEPRVAATAAHAGLESAADPVHRLKARLGGAGGTMAVAQAAPDPVAAAEPRNIVLASAIYVTGSRGLQAGSRYGIALVGDELRILGPVDFDPTAVALVHSLRGVDATGLQARLVITGGDGRRERLALVFMSVAGGSPEGVADAIVAAAAAVGDRPR